MTSIELCFPKACCHSCLFDCGVRPLALQGPRVIPLPSCNTIRILDPSLTFKSIFDIA